MFTKQQCILKIKKLYQTDKVNYIRKIKKDIELIQTINFFTPLLKDQFYTIHTKIYRLINQIIDFPICPTCKKKFGQNRNISLKKGYPIYCSKICMDQNLQRREKIKNTCIAKKQQTSKKIKQTCLKKYGVENVSQVPQIMNKVKLSIKRTYQQKKEEILKKYKETSKQKYGYQFYSQTPEFKNYISTKLKNNIQFFQRNKKLLIERYGVEYSINIPHVRQKQIKEKNDRAYETILSWKDYVIPLFTREEYKSRSAKKIYKWKCVSCGNIFQQELGKNWHFIQKIPSQYMPRCLNCYPLLNQKSQKEKQLALFCKEYFTNIEENNKNIISPHELDIVIPDIKLAIEFNGLFWHSIERKQHNYHLLKTQLCEKQGYRLIHIWQNDWDNNKEEIKQKLLNIFFNNQQKITQNQIILDRCWYQLKQIEGYKIEIMQPKIQIKLGFSIQNCGYIKYIKIKEK